VDLLEVDRVASDTLGFPLMSYTRKFRNQCQKVLGRTLVRKTTPARRRAFALALHQRHDPYALITNRSRTVAITRNLGQGEIPTAADIGNMVKAFLRELRDHAHIVTVLKRLLLTDLTDKIGHMWSLNPRLSPFPRPGSRCILSSLKYAVQRLEMET